MLWISLLDFDPASVYDVYARSEQQLGMCTEPLGTCTVTAGYAQKHLAKCTESLDIYIKLYKTFFRPQPGTAPFWSPEQEGCVGTGQGREVTYKAIAGI